jgi:MarR family transcriptional regulator, repressor for mepA
MSDAVPEFDTVLGLLRWIGWAQRKAGEDWVRARDLSQEQAFALGFLVQQPGAIQRDLAEITRTTPASVTSLLQGLEARGLVERRPDPDNGRTKRVFATDAGADLIAGFGDTMAATDESILAPLSAAERDELLGLLRKITAQLERPHR